MQASSSNDGDVARGEHRALMVSALIAVAAIVVLVWPVGMGVLLGVLFAFTFRPMYERIARGRSSSTAALAVVLGSALAILLTFGALVWILVRDGTVLTRAAVESLRTHARAHEMLLAVDRVTTRFGISNADLDTKAHALAKTAAVAAAGMAQQVVSTAARTVLALFFVMLTMYFLLRRWLSVGKALMDVVPLRPDYTRKLLEEFRRVGRTTLMSTVVIGLLQGALATIGYWIVGVPSPLFFGVLTAIASLVPGLGTMLVWLPASVALVLLHRVVGGVFLAVWGVTVLTAIPTYVIRPRLVGAGASPVPALFTFVSLFGGAAMFGLSGLILGPVLMAVASATLRIYAAEERARRHQ